MSRDRSFERRPRRVRGFGAAAVVCVAYASVVTATGAASAVAPSTAATTVFGKSTASALALTTPGMHTVQSVKLAAGTWTVMSKASATDPGSADFFRCQLVDKTHATVLDGATTQLGASLPSDVITDLAVISVTSQVTVTQQCGHDGTAGNSGSVDAGASLIGFVSQPSRVRAVRTSTQTALGGGPSVAVVNLSLPKGSWVVAAKLSPVDLTSFEGAVTCAYDPADSFERYVGTAGGFKGVSTIFHVGAVALSAPTTLTLACSSDRSTAYLDPNTVVWAWKATDLHAADTGACPVTLSAPTTADALVLHQRNCALNVGPFATEMAGGTVHSGTWVALAGVDELGYTGYSNLDHCEILDVAHGRQLDVSTASESDAQPALVTGMTNLAVVSVKKRLSFEGRCGEDQVPGAAGAIADSGWAFIRP